MLHCYAALLKKCVNYAHEIVKLCAKMCLTDTGLILQCTQTVDQIAADSSDELAVLGQSLNSVGCSLSLDSLTR